MKNNNKKSFITHHGFTLVEVMIAITLFSLIMGGTVTTYLMCQRVWHSTSLKIRNTHEANLAISRLVYGIGTNEGLRSAASIDVDTGYAGIYLSATPPTNYPPPANAANHYLTTDTGDGSWRMTVSNYNNQTMNIDYNINSSNLVFWPPASVSANRQLIANHVTSATATTTNDGILISFSIVRRDGNFSASNNVSTFLKTRN